MKIAIRNYKDRPKQTNIENVCHQENFTTKMEWDHVYVFPALKISAFANWSIFVPHYLWSLCWVSLLLKSGVEKNERMIPSKPA